MCHSDFTLVFVKTAELVPFIGFGHITPSGGQIFKIQSVQRFLLSGLRPLHNF